MRALLLILLACGVAAAQPKKAPAPTRKVPPPKGDMVVVAPSRDNTPHREGEYGGVQPGSGPKDKPAKPKRLPPKGTLSWIGFEAKDGGAQLFFQSVSSFNVTQKLEGNTLVIHLALSRLGANTWRQIDTRFFDNPLSFVVARQGRGGIDVRVTFKNPKDAKEGALRPATADADGMFYAYVGFPEGTEASGGSKEPSPKDPEK